MKKTRILQYISPSATSINPFAFGPYHLNEESCLMGKIMPFQDFKNALKTVNADIEALEEQGLNSNPFHSNEQWVYIGIETEKEILISYWHKDEFIVPENLDTFNEEDNIGIIDLCASSYSIDRWLIHASTPTEVIEKITEFEKTIH